MIETSRWFCHSLIGLSVAMCCVAAAGAALGNEQGDAVRVRGRVVDPDDKPVAGARVAVPSATGWDYRLARRPVAQTTTDADGRFEITFKKADVSPFTTGGGSPGLENWKHTPVVASAEGFGLAFQSWQKTDADGDVILKLVPDDSPIEGRILDLEGQAVAGVNVIVSSVGVRDQKLIEEAYQKDRASISGLMLGLPLSAIGDTTPILSGPDGRFTIRGMGRDRMVNLYLHGERIGYARLNVITKPMEPETFTIPQPIGSSPKFVNYGAKFDYTATPGRTVRGTLTDAATKKPLAGVNVQSMRFAGPFQGFDPQGMISCVTDEQGKYVLHGFPKGKGNQIIAVPNDDQPYFMREAEVEDSPGLAPVTLDLELHKGVFVTGKVTDKKTGQPLPARLIYSTYLDNKHTHDLPEFKRRDGAGVLDGYQSRYETKAGGVYRVVAAPGKALVGVWCMMDGYRKGAGFDEIPIFKEEDFVLRLYQPNFWSQSTNIVKEVDVPVGAESVTCDLELDPGETIKVAIVGPGGKPAQGPFQIRGHEPENYGGWHGDQWEKLEFDAVGFGPGDERTLFVIDRQRKLGRAMRVKFDQAKDRRVTIELQPLAEVSGRVLNTEGDPIPDLPLEPDEHVRNGHALPMVKTDTDGRFTASLVPGTRYYLRVWGGPYAGRTVGKDLDPKPGEKKNLGDVKIEPYMMQ